MSVGTLSPREQIHAPAVNRQLRVAYMMSRFPKLTETFVLTEMMAMEAQGIFIDVFPLQRERAKVVHEDARPFVERAYFTPWFSLRILCAHLMFLFTKPLTYFNTLGTIFWANLGSWRYLGGALLFFPKAVYLARLMQQKQITHLHAHFASHPAMVAYVIHQLTGIPWSFTSHGSDLHRDQHMLAEKIGSAKITVAISNYNRNFILDQCGLPTDEKIKIIHCGVDLNDYAPRQSATAWAEKKGPFRILCIGTLHEVKGQRYLLEACAELNSQVFDFECHLVGDGPDRADLKALATTLGIDKRVTFHGSLTREEIQQQLFRSDVLVAPSVQTQCGRREGIPVVLMEALASGVPAIGSNLSGIPEILSDEQTGLLTPPRDAAAIAAALIRLANDGELRQQLSVAGRRKIEEEFNLHQNAVHLSSHFQQGEFS